MDPATLLGMVVALGALLTMMLLEGADPLAVFLLPPLILVFGATFGAVVATSTMSDLRRIGSWFRQAFTADRTTDRVQAVALLVDLATTARKEGLLPLENRVDRLEDPFLRRGLRMVIDGVPLVQMRTVLEAEIEAQRADDRVAARFFAKMGGYAPTIGIIGTVVGLIQVMYRLEDADALGPLIAAAFVATLWGVLSANFFWFPMGAKIARNSELRTARMNLVLEGVTEILEGSSPRALRVRLQSMLPPSEARHTAA
jgi:chemotaxis protein MotA